MPAIKEIDKFYHSAKWKRCRAYVVSLHRGVCQRCGMPGTEVHHIIPLTIDNVNDPFIALNPDNLELLCKSCHDMERRKYDDVRGDLKFDEQGNLVKR